MPTALFSHPDCLRHVTPPGHPERVERLAAIEAALAGFDLDRRAAPLATEADLRRCHPQGYIDAVRAAVPETGFRALDADTQVSPGSWNAALRAVGGCLAAVDAVLAGDVRNAFVATRPPGHHAEAELPMGFCLFGTVALAAKHALDHHGLARVAIVDFDVHHGNGTQASPVGRAPRALLLLAPDAALARHRRAGRTRRLGQHPERPARARHRRRRDAKRSTKPKSCPPSMPSHPT